MRLRSSLRRQAARAAVLCGVLGVLAASVATPSLAVAQVRCGPAGDDPPAQIPWPLRRLDPESVWPLTRGEGVVVAVIDSGVSNIHPTLEGKVLPGRDLGLPASSGMCDEDGHGTLVAGIIAGRDSTGVPFSGVAPGASILPVRVLPDRTRSFDDDLPIRIAEAIRWAVDNDADVVNLSLETVPARALKEAVTYARQQDVVLVAAAGNVEQDQAARPAYPAAYDEVIAVAGVDEQGGHVLSSVVGDYITVAAPGAGIDGPAPGGEGYVFQPEGGTSYATAYVSGVVALVRAYYPDLPASEVVRRVTRTADSPPAGRNAQVGYGVVNPYRAVATVLGSRSNPPAAALELAPAAPDPLAREKVIAGWTALGGGVLFVVLLLGAPAVRRGRQRGWRPGRPVRHEDSEPAKGSTVPDSIVSTASSAGPTTPGID